VHIAVGKNNKSMNMNMPLKHVDMLPRPTTRATPLAIESGEGHGVKFPQRPDAGVLSIAIPLFYIGKNQHGFWVARDAEGRSGGVFLLKRSALRFATKKSEPAGCATMFLTESFELDIENRGSRIIAALAASLKFATLRAPLLSAFIGMAVANWRKVNAQISRARAGERRNRDALERELFHGQYRLSSKSDDDLPVPCARITTILRR
jgi:hypothetical protein